MVWQPRALRDPVFGRREGERGQVGALAFGRFVGLDVALAGRGEDLRCTP